MRIAVTVDPATVAPPGLVDSAVRYFIKNPLPLYVLVLVNVSTGAVDGLTAVINLIVFVSIFFNVRRQGVHDRIVKTYVVDVTRTTSPAAPTW
jgi:uncharacterized RDD family membrane protein YckC